MAYRQKAKTGSQYRPSQGTVGELMMFGKPSAGQWLSSAKRNSTTPTRRARASHRPAELLSRAGDGLLNIGKARTHIAVMNASGFAMILIICQLPDASCSLPVASGDKAQSSLAGNSQLRNSEPMRSIGTPP